jgi:hypothetical protein
VSAAERLEGSRGDESMEITGDLSRRRAEALVLEVRQLAKRYGVEVRCRIGRTTDAPRTSAQ